jgi:protein SCO1/2
MNTDKHKLFDGIIFGILLLLAGCQSAPPTPTPPPAYEYKGVIVDPPLEVPDFELTANDGQPLRLSELKEDVTLIFFGYTFCPDVCPLTLVNVKQALAGLPEPERVRVLFISVDPERDSPAVMTRYVKNFGPQFTGLTAASVAEMQEILKPFGAFAAKEEVPDSAAGYLMAHSTRLYLVIPQKRLMLLQYQHGFLPEELQSDLAHLLNRENFRR